MSLPLPRLIVFTDHTLCSEPERQLAPLLEGAPKGQILVVLRDKNLNFRARFEIGERLQRLTERTQQRLSIAESLDLTRALRASALHLPSGGVAATEARSLLPEGFLSRALHSGEELPPSEQVALDALVVSPVLAPRKGRAPLGVASIEGFRRSYPRLGLYGLGGVDADNVECCLAAGWTGVAMQGAALNRDPLRLLGPLFGLR